MNLVTLDYETYYDKEFSLSKMSTEDYVNDDRFQTIMVSIKKNAEPVLWHTGTHDSITQWLFDNGVHKAGVVCHNHMFDGLVSQIHHDLNPPIMFCTRFMAKATLQPYVRSVSLDACLKYLNAPFTKGTYLANMLGRRREDLSKSEMRDYAAYCCTDTEATAWLFQDLLKRLPREELSVIDMTLRMYLQPELIADPEVFRAVRDNDIAAKQALIDAMPPEVQRADLMSNQKFAELLMDLGIEPPRKISPTTNKSTYAFAKTDAGWKDLEEDYADEPNVAAILAARVGTKSTITETRSERMYQIGKRYGKFRVPLVYYSAHTGRYGGTEKINAQNLSRVKRNKDGTPTTREQLRFGLLAPKDHSVLAVDASQVEARINAWLSGCKPLVTMFRDGQDVYSAFATRLYSTPISKAQPLERFVGKTCFTSDTKILTDRGVIHIVDVQITDRLWDGEEWVTHSGLIQQGRRKAMRGYGVGATPDHEIYLGDTKREWHMVLESPSLMQLAIESVNLPSSNGPTPIGAGTRSAYAHAGRFRLLTETIYSQENQPAAISVLKKHPQASGGASTKPRYPMMGIGAAYSIVYRRLLPDAITRGLGYITRMVAEGFTSIKGGGMIALRFCSTFKPSPVGTILPCTWIGLTTALDTPPATLDSPQSSRTWGISGRSTLSSLRSMSYERVYDIANAGPRHRFTVVSDRGPIVVSNCILGLGYGMGWSKLRATLRKDNIKITEDVAKHYVDTYRSEYPEIPQLWNTCDRDVLSVLHSGGKLNIGPCVVTRGLITLPNGMTLDYHGMRHLKASGGKRDGWGYEYAGRVKGMWGGSLVENMVQALARIKITEAMRDNLSELGFRPVLQAHDELVYSVPTKQAQALQKEMELIMSRPPAWALDLPLAAEGGYGPTYGDCK